MEQIYPRPINNIEVGDLIHFDVFEGNVLRKVVGMLVKIDYSPLGPHGNGFAGIANLDEPSYNGFICQRGHVFTDRIPLTQSSSSTTVDDVNKTFYLKTFPIKVTKVFRPSGRLASYYDED